MTSTEHEYMTTGEVAAMFRVTAATVRRWCNEGLIPFVLTPTGHRRIAKTDAMKAMYGEPDEPRLGGPMLIAVAG